MLYLKHFKILDANGEYSVFGYEARRIYNNSYPLGIFPEREFTEIDFEPITIFYGGNGSGKTTLLNIISEKLQANRKSFFDKGTYFINYVDRCSYDMSTIDKPIDIKMITSDDVFDYLLDIRSINSNINRRKEDLCDEYLSAKFEQKSSFESYEEIKNRSDSRRMTMSKYVRHRLTNNNIIEKSNGESALAFWEREIQDNSLYILDEPENSLSAENQIKIKQFIEDSARFYNCQFIISTHSPFILSLLGAKIYDLDSVPVKNKKWTELDNIKSYYEFFKDNEDKFKKSS